MPPAEDDSTGQNLAPELLEALAAIEHERWAHWQEYVHSLCTPTSDGSLLIPAELVERWKKQAATPYGDLNEEEQESDREQVRRYLPTILSGLMTVLGKD